MLQARLNRIAGSLELVERVEPDTRRGEVLDRLKRGEITADEAVALLERGP